jgi:hypothetical protein
MQSAWLPAYAGFRRSALPRGPSKQGIITSNISVKIRVEIEG